MRQNKSLAITCLWLLFFGIIVVFEQELFAKQSEPSTALETSFIGQYEKIWSDLTYFPVPLSTKDPNAQIQFENSWQFERNYGGTYGHEGTDLMPDRDVNNRYPIVSMTSGTVEKIGWLEKGGYRIGIRSENDIYYYYAHLSSYARDFQVGEHVDAGEWLGFMGDTGYGVEGTTGMFPVHLHVGIYIRIEDTHEIAVNPYWFLRYLENFKLRYAYE